MLHESAVLILNPHPQASHALVVEVAFGGELLWCLEHRVEVARGGEDGISEQLVAPATALLVVPEEFNKLQQQSECQGFGRLVGVERPGVNDMDTVGKNEGDVLDAVTLVVSGIHFLLIHSCVQVVDLSARPRYGHEVAVQEANHLAVAAALVL
eukprot:3137053-Rhodomonas_salina.3